MSRFAEILRKKDFVITFELVPGRSTRTRHFRAIMRFAEEVAEAGLFDALSITDNAGGHPALAPEALGRELKRLGHEPIIHFSCKDKNRNVIESDLLDLDREGLRTLLVVTGDYPRYGYRGRAKPVFDLDSVQLLRLISEMRKGYVLPPEVPGGGVTLPPVPFFPGCVVNPFKWTEAETLLQYWKLLKKIRAGASFVITQVGFSARKYQELLFFLQEEGLSGFPALAGILVMDQRLARILYRGIVPGITVPEGLYRRLMGLSEEEARKEALERAARLMAVCQGLGYRGVHLCGAPLEKEAVHQLLVLYEEYRPHWREFLPEFAEVPEKAYFLYRKDPRTGLNLPERKPLSPSRSRNLLYFFSRIAHKLFFTRKGPLARPLRFLAHRLSGSSWEPLFTRLEYGIKKVLYDCQECGDCSLPHLAFLCTQSQCAKYLLNGPCGGSRDRWCEVYPGRRRCVFVRIYERLSPEERPQVFLKELSPRNWNLFRTSSWLNFYLGRTTLSPKKVKDL
ncbi:MAG: methylenetetrahydrofolate reductase [Thermodesulfatator sp.]|nr:MAG: methylenetetrahydrofolate reductase [Thermodesulfatator sp.]